VDPPLHGRVESLIIRISRFIDPSRRVPLLPVAAAVARVARIIYNTRVMETNYGRIERDVKRKKKILRPGRGHDNNSVRTVRIFV